MTYNPNTPLASERISETQEPIRNNFEQANTIFGIDHFEFDAVSDNGKHKQTTFPDRALTPPAPGASECAIYGVNSANGTTPQLRRDGLTVDYAVLPIRAFGSFTGAGATVNAQNLSSSAFNMASGYTMTMPADTVTGTSYGVLVIAGDNDLTPLFAPGYVIVNATTFQVGFRRNDNGSFTTPDFFTVAVFQV